MTWHLGNNWSCNVSIESNKFIHNVTVYTINIDFWCSVTRSRKVNFGSNGLAILRNLRLNFQVTFIFWLFGQNTDLKVLTAN